MSRPPFHLRLVAAGALFSALTGLASAAQATERRLFILNRTNSTIATVSAVRSGDITKFAKLVSRDRISGGSRGEVVINDIYDACTFQVVLDFPFGADVTKPVNLCVKAPTLVVTASDRL